MHKIVLDPSLFECAEHANKQEQYEHYIFLRDCISFLSEFCDVFIDSYEGAPYTYKTPDHLVPPITRSSYIRSNYMEIRKCILKMQRKANEYIDLADAPCAKIDNMKFVENSLCKDAFLRYISALGDLGDSILVLGQKNKCSCVYAVCNNQRICVDTIYAPATDCSNRVYKLLATPQEVTEPFNYVNSCKSLNDAFTQEISSNSGAYGDNLAVIRKYGSEFASRNRYKHDADLARKNPKYTVYSNDNRTYAISIDQEHGGLELFMKKQKGYIHLGEFNFSGIKTKDADPVTHKLNS